MNKFGETAGAILAGILTIALVAVIVGRQSQTSTVITSAGSALTSVINAAVAPVTTGTSNGLIAGTAVANLFTGGL